MSEKKTKNLEVKIDLPYSTPSDHILNLKSRREDNKIADIRAVDFVIQSNTKKTLNSLFIVSFFRFLFFLPKLVFINIPKSIGRSFKRNTEGASEKISVVFNINPPYRWGRALGGFAVLALILVLPIKVFGSYELLANQKDLVIAEGLEGYEELKKNNYSAAGESFENAKDAIDGIGFVLKHILIAIPGIGDKLSLGSGLLTFGQNVSKAAESLGEAVEYFNQDVLMVDKVRFLQSSVRSAIPDLLVAGSVLSKMHDSDFLPISISSLKDMLFGGTRALLVFDNFSDTLLDILGDKTFKRYLFIFQNNNELRATGGFIGSFAILDVDRGEITALEIPGGGSYDIQGQLKEMVLAPEPMQLINARWEFQDSNWFPDFPEAAKKMMWFYEKADGPSVDGVVAVNATFMEDLLDFIGPIEMDEYGRTIDSSNFMDETQKIVELEYDKQENKPKQFIADLAPKVLNNLMSIDATKLGEFSNIIHKAILEKDVMVYSKDAVTQDKLKSFGLSGALKDASKFTDYLMVIDTNIAGQKTDGKIVKNIEHNSIVEADGSIINTVKITRTHTGIKGDLFSGVRNVNYVRVYVPLGSELLDAGGFRVPPQDLFDIPDGSLSLDSDLERVQGHVYADSKTGVKINNEFGRTVFGGWTMVDPGQSEVITFKYRLPDKLALDEPSGLEEELASYLDLDNKFLPYTMLIEKQSGAKNVSFKSNVSLNRGGSVARVGSGAVLTDNGWQYKNTLDKDLYYGVVLE